MEDKRPYIIKFNDFGQVYLGAKSAEEAITLFRKFYPLEDYKLTSLGLLEGEYIE